MSVPVGESAPVFVVLGLRYGVVATASSSIKCSRLQPHLDGDVDKLLGVVWFLRISSNWGDLRISMELHRRLFLLRLRYGCGLLDPFDFPSATNNARQTHVGAAAVAHRRHVLEVEDEEHLKDFIVIFCFFGVFCIV
jgi:hypothetical protein